MRLAKIISFVFHPLWMPLIIYLTTTGFIPVYMHGAVHRFILFLFLINIVAPAASIFIMIRFKLLSNIELQERTERTGPYLLVIFYFLLTFLLLKWKAPFIPLEIFSLFVGVIVSLSMALVINMWWKISTHMMAQGGWAGVLLALAFIYHAPVLAILVLVIFVAGMVAYARVRLGVHTHAQVYAGFLLGAIINYAAMMIMCTG